MDVFKFFGAHYVSIDLNKGAKALPIDLNEEIMEQSLIDSFHIVTNFGTTEHVASQLGVFRNIHQLTRIGGVMVHHVPLAETDHGDFGYNESWFTKLSTDCNYIIKLIQKFRASIVEPYSYVQAILIKTHRSSFNLEQFTDPPRVGAIKHETPSECDNVCIEPRRLGTGNSSPNPGISRGCTT
jgi:hypothetical protein